MSFLVTSVVASIVLTIAANLTLRVVTRQSHRSNRHRNDPSEGSRAPWPSGGSPITTRVFFPWKLMLAVSVIATLMYNVAR